MYVCGPGVDSWIGFRCGLEIWVDICTWIRNAHFVQRLIFYPFAQNKSSAL